MAEAKLEIQIDVDGVAKAKAQLRSVESSIKSIDSRTRGLASTSGSSGEMITTVVNKWKKSFDQFDKIVRTVGSVGLKALTMSLKFAGLEMVAMGAAMVAIHGAFVLGNAAMKAMRATLGPLAAGMTAVVAAAATAAAAIREQQAAMFAYKTKSAPEFGSGLNQTRQVMRTLYTDASLATVGVENLNKAYATVSKTSTFTAQSQKTLKGLMDFASAGQPIEEGIQKAADLIAILQNSKKSFSEAKSSAQQLFPDKEKIDKAFKDLKITTKKGLEQAITSGALAKAADLEGQFDAVSGTLINRMKGYLTVLKNMFGDVGQPMLESVKVAANDIFNILRRGFVKISGNTQKFGMGSMLEGLVSMVDKLTTWSTDLINNNIKSVDGMFSKMAGWWKDFRYGWNAVLDKLRPMIEGARVIEKMFGEVWKHVKNVVSSSFNQFNEWLVNNEATVIEFGGKVGDLISSIMKFQQEMKKILQDLMPIINNIVGGLSQMVDMMTGFVKLLRGLTGGGAIGALASLFAVRGTMGAMKNIKGGWTVSQKISTQPINADQVILNSPSVVTGGGNLGTTGAAMRGGAGAGASGLASSSVPGAPVGPVYPGGPPGGGGGGGGGRGGPTPQTGPAIPMVGQQGYQPGLIHGPQRTRSRRMAAGAYNRFRTWSYDTFTMPGEDDETRQNRLATRTRTDRFGNEKYTKRALFRQRQAAQRAARSGKNMSRGYRNMAKFQGSQTARMGTGLALGAMSQFAPEEAQGALALGGMVSTVNPLAGLGVAGLGVALKSKTATGGAVSGLAGGAAMGAALGSIIPGIGTAAGAVTGALIGAVSGGIMGSINADKAKVKAARTAASNAAQSIINNVLSGVLDGVREEYASGAKGRTKLRNALPSIRARQKNVLDIIDQAPGKRGNYYGIVPDFMDRGATGGQTGLALESATGKRMPGFMRKALGSATTNMDIVGNLAYGTLSKLGGVSLLDNRVLNPLGYQTNNKKDVDKQKQEAALRKMYVNQKSLGLTISEKEFDEMTKKPGDALEQMKKDMQNNEDAMKPLQKNYGSRMDELNRITGKTDTEINALAKTMGVNLYDSTKDFNEVLSELGLTTVKTTDQLRAATTKVYAEGLKGFDKALEKIKAPRILDETAKGFAQLARANKGKVSEEDKTNFVRDIMEQNLALFGGDAQKAYAQTVKSLGTGGTAYKGTGPLRGMEGLGLLQSDAIKAILGDMQSGFASENSTQLNAYLSGNDKNMAVDSGEFQRRFKAMTVDQQMQVKTALERAGDGTLFSGAAGMRMLDAAGGDTNQALLNAIGMGDLAMKKIEQPVLDLSEASNEIAKSTNTLIEQMKVYFTEANEAVPSWYNTPPSWYKGDTSTPRGSAFGDTSSRLSQTMARHASMNGMLTGTRTVTSGYRTFGLGSMNSDHVTGRAYDLVGQNLGQYQSLVRATGGFAEFHGVNGARHLHVVPGSGPIGDRKVPVMGGAGGATVQMSGGAGGNNYNFYISGNQNASAKEIADMVMQKVKDTERSNRERR